MEEALKFYDQEIDMKGKKVDFMIKKDSQQVDRFFDPLITKRLTDEFPKNALKHIPFEVVNKVGSVHQDC